MHFVFILYTSYLIHDTIFYWGVAKQKINWGVAKR